MLVPSLFLLTRKMKDKDSSLPRAMARAAPSQDATDDISTQAVSQVGKVAAANASSPARIAAAANTGTPANVAAAAGVILNSVAVAAAAAAPSSVPAPQVAATAANAPAIDKGPIHNSPDIAIGMAQKTNAMNLAVFIRTLRKHSPKCDIMLFIDVLTPRARELFEAYSVRYEVFNITELEPERMRKWHPSTSRWVLLLNFFEQHAKRVEKSQANAYKRVVLADIRDMAFQSDPFELIKDDESALHVFHGDKTIGLEGWNKGWITDCYGKDVADKLSNHPVICSGISIGSLDVVVPYLRAMVQDILSPQFSVCERNGVDQGAHNVLIHTGKITHVIKHDQTTGLVANMQARIMVVSKGQVVNPLGQKAVIIHQYDRDLDLMTKLFRDNVGWNAQDDFQGAGVCEGYTLRNNVELFHSVGDFNGNHVGPKQGEPPFTYLDCCRLCSAHKLCKSFSQMQTSCWLKAVAGPQASIKTIPWPDVTGGWKT